MKKIVSAVCLFFAAVVTIAASGHVKHVTAIGEVLGDGAKTTAVPSSMTLPSSTAVFLQHPTPLTGAR